MTNDAQLLTQILDDSSELIYIADSTTHEMLYANANAIQRAVHGDESYLGQKCYKWRYDRDEMCEFCHFHNEGWEHDERDVVSPNNARHVRTRKCVWQGHEASTVYLADINKQHQTIENYNSQIDSILTSTYQAHGFYQVDLDSDCVLKINGNALQGKKVEDFKTADSLFAYMTNYAADPMTRKKAFEVFNRKSLIEAFNRGQTEVRFRCKARYLDGSIRNTTITTHLMGNPVTKHIECITYGMDVSERQTLVDKYREIVTMDSILARDFSIIFLIDLNEGLGYRKKIDRRLNETAMRLPETFDFDIVMQSFTQTFIIDQYDDQDYDILRTERLREYFSDPANRSLYFRYRIMPNEIGQQYFEARILPFNDERTMLILGVKCIDQIIRREEAERQKLREALKDAQEAREDAMAANAAKTSFLFNMSHDIRTPMNAIIGFTNLLDKYQEDAARRADYLTKISQSSQVLLSIINNVLEMARIEKGTVAIEETSWDAKNFNDTLYSTFSELMAQRSITFTREVDVQHTCVKCDPIKLREIYYNLLSNACKYTNPGGSVHMSVKEVEGPKEGYAYYRTSISDTGIGMSEEFLPHVFEEFTRESNTTHNKIEGTGLGMPIVKRLVEMLDGTIEVQSQKGVGTTFTVTIPHKITDAAELVEHGGVALDPTLFTGKRLLLTEDNDLNAEIATEILQEVGFIVDRAENGQRCIDMLSNSEKGYYSLILMDIQMPVMNGYDATRAIRQLAIKSKSRIPIIAMTANAFEEDKLEAMRAGMNGHVAKPINVPELMMEIAAVIQ